MNDRPYFMKPGVGEGADIFLYWSPAFGGDWNLDEDTDPYDDVWAYSLYSAASTPPSGGWLVDDGGESSRAVRNLRKKLEKLAKKKAFKELQPRLKSIINHFAPPPLGIK